ncbi:MAG: hypothetical protein JOZ78_10930 [Chroococcidiopsidaceae cyanobacterium CP_BM_ER_R8_30]|nr:hypothetical protein [Chroococcidiopsidaceae cyanobacterium CP_BM_ER_R8_30]
MLALFLFFIIFCIYIWLAYKPRHTSTQQQRTHSTATASAVKENKTATDIKQSPLGTELIVDTNQPAGPDMPGPSGRELIPVEEIAPEVELAPPAEPPGPGDPIDRQNPPPPPEAMEAIPIAIPQAAPSPSLEPEPSEKGETPELIRPHPPSPELIEAAIQDSVEKSQS